jgi:hypothetical protein
MPSMQSEANANQIERAPRNFCALLNWHRDSRATNRAAPPKFPVAR